MPTTHQRSALETRPDWIFGDADRYMIIENDPPPVTCWKTKYRRYTMAEMEQMNIMNVKKTEPVINILPLD